jgi:hypothetical protein
MQYIAPTAPPFLFLTDFFGVNIQISYDCEILIDVTANSTKLEPVILTVDRNRDVSVFPLSTNHNVLAHQFNFPNLYKLLSDLEKYKLNEKMGIKQ